MIYLILAYVIPMLFLIYRAKKTNNIILGKLAFFPILNVLFTFAELGDIYEEWILK